MAIDINDLSSDELFELANKRKREEEETESRKAAIVVMKNRRKQLEAEHAKALAGVDSQIRGLHEQRAQVIIRHKTEVDQIDKELTELVRQVKQAEASAARTVRKAEPPQAEPVRTAEPPQADTVRKAEPPQADTVYADAILATLERRTDISESLLKEQLRAGGLDTTELRRQLDQLVREGRLVHKGSGNYALGRRR
jgi:vacuolar-type H+-ATPase subunit H